MTRPTRPLAAKIADLERRAAALDAELKRERARLREAERRRETRRRIIVGAAILARAEREPSAADHLRRILDAYVTVPADREFLGLGPLPDGETDPETGPE